MLQAIKLSSGLDALLIPHATNGDALPSGEYAASLTGQHIETHLGSIPFPPGEPWGLHYIRVTNVGGFKFIGQGHSASALGMWEYVNGQWVRHPESVGDGPAIYDLQGQLHIEPVSDSRGFRQVLPNGQILLSADTSPASHGVNKWSQLGALLIGQGNAHGGVVVFDGHELRVLDNTAIVEFIHVQGFGPLSIAYARPDGVVIVHTTVAVLKMLPLAPSAPFEPHQVLPPRAADGRLYPLAPFIHCDPALAARGGEGQQENVQVEHPDGLIVFGKFGQAGSTEGYGVDANWFTSIWDASGPKEIQTWTDPRWFPMHMAIGEAHAFVTGPHEAIYYDRLTCKELRRVPFNRKMWLHAFWDEFDWGPDLGVKPTIMLVYDPTDGFHSDKRIVEVLFYVDGAGWVRWEAHRSDLVYAHGAAQFSDATLAVDEHGNKQRVNFFRLAASAVQPQLPGCVSTQVPHLPPVVPPAPKPIPSPTPKPKMPTVKTGYFKKDGKYVGIDPGDPQGKVYADRDRGDIWEHAQVTLHDDGNWDGLFLLANKQLSIQPNGSLESRVAGTYGGYEQLQIRTEDGSQRTVVYRNDLDGSLLQFEEDQ